MSRLVANRGDELIISGNTSNIMGHYDVTDDEFPGCAVLSGTNQFPNPDLVDEDQRGRVRGGYLDAPPSPDSWNVYATRLTRIDNSGNHILLDNPAPFLRQNEQSLPAHKHTYMQDHPLNTDKSMPDLAQDEPTDLAPVLDAPRADVVTTAGNIGYPAQSSGALWASYAGILGRNPMTSSRLTPAAPAVQIGAISAGNVIKFTMPSTIPGSWSGIAFLVGPDVSHMKVQKRVDLRSGKAITTVIDHGPFTRADLTVDASTDRTYMGSYQEFGAPKIWHAHSTLDLVANSQPYELSYKLLTKQGPTADQTIGTETVSNRQNGEVLMWSPPKEAFRQPGITGWIPTFRAKNGKWYTFKDAKGGYPLSRAARIHTKNTDKDLWKGPSRPVEENRTTHDSSGVPPPKDAMEIPTAQGPQQLVSGRYAIRVTSANEKLDMESRPSPHVMVTLRDAGVFGGGAATGVTDQSFRVFRPHPQNIKNARIMENDPATGKQTLHWALDQASGSNGVTITEGDGFLTVGDTAGTVTNYRRTSAEPCNPNLFYTFRYHFVMNSRTSGAANIIAQFYSDAAGTTAIGSGQVLESFNTVADHGHVKNTAGPVDGAGNVDIPANAVSYRIAIRGTGVHNFTISNIGVFAGRSHPRKLYDIIMGTDTPHRDVWPVPDAEDATFHYPPGPYCRPVVSPADGARHLNYSVIESKYFDDGSLTSGGWTTVTTTGGTLTASAQYAIRGAFSARSDLSSSSVINGGAYIWKDFTNAGRNTFGMDTLYRVKALPSSGNVVLMGASRDAGLVNYLANAQLTSAGVLNLNWYNGAGMSTSAVPGITVQQGDDLRLELSFSGLRTNSGAVTLFVKRNDRAVVSVGATSITWATGSQNVNRVLVGIQNGSAATQTARVIYDGVRTTTNGMNEGSAIPGNMIEYWAPEGQPAHNPNHMYTGMRWPVQPNQQRTFSVYARYLGVTTPTGGASIGRLVSFDSSGNAVKDHGWTATGLLGRDHWDRYNQTYTTAAVANGDDGDAAYVEFTRNEIGDGAWQMMGFQDQTGATATAFDNTNATTGTLSVIFKTTLTGGALGGDRSMLLSYLRMHVNATTPAGTSITGIQARGSNTYNTSTRTLTSPSSFVSDITTLANFDYVEVQATLNGTSTTSPEVRGVFVDPVRPQPIVCLADGRDFNGGILAYLLTPDSPKPVVVRKEYADGSVGMEHVGREIPKTLKLSLAALTDLGKWQCERNPALDRPEYLVDTGVSRYVVLMAPEFTGSQESEPDGTAYFNYTSEGIEADVIGVENP